MASTARPLVNRRSLLGAGVALAAFKAAASPKTPPVVTILGDSITAGLGLAATDALPAQLQAALGRLGLDAVVRGAGVSGDTTAGGLARLDFSVQPDTTLCVVELGGNDFLQSLPAEETRRNLIAIIARLRKRHIRVVVCKAAPPSKSSGAYGSEVAAFFKSLSQTQGVTVTPDLLAGILDNPSMMQSDGLHPNARGARRIAETVAPIVARVLREPLRPRP